ncbi:MAG: archease [Alphaproteobacteria bacterium]|nr:archease [Alphaproteobacteria bacterium]
MAFESAAEHFSHAADIGVRGIGRTKEQAFENAALALTGIVTEATGVVAEKAVEIECQAPSDELLLVDWLNQLIYEMAVRHMLFGRFAVTLENGRLRGRAWGEKVDRLRHAPVVEPKGATFTVLKVERRADGAWVAQCVIDV